eukprot:scaffold95460_cov32-Tisochrysis_lutea.AAC.1
MALTLRSHILRARLEQLAELGVATGHLEVTTNRKALAAYFEADTQNVSGDTDNARLGLHGERPCGVRLHRHMRVLRHIGNEFEPLVTAEQSGLHDGGDVIGAVVHDTTVRGARAVLEHIEFHVTDVDAMLVRLDARFLTIQ